MSNVTTAIVCSWWSATGGGGEASLCNLIFNLYESCKMLDQHNITSQQLKPEQEPTLQWRQGWGVWSLPAGQPSPRPPEQWGEMIVILLQSCIHLTRPHLVQVVSVTGDVWGPRQVNTGGATQTLLLPCCPICLNNKLLEQPLFPLQKSVQIYLKYILWKSQKQWTLKTLESLSVSWPPAGGPGAGLTS